MKFFFTISLLFLSIVINAQNTAFFNIAHKGQIEKIISTSDNGYITLGLDTLMKNAQIIKWDNLFNPIWKIKYIDTSMFSSYGDIIESTDGYFYYAAITNNSSGNGQGPGVVSKISNTGTIIWQKAFYSNTFWQPLRIQTISKPLPNENGFIISITACGVVSIITRVDGNGNILWNKRYYYYPHPDLTSYWNIGTNSIIPENNHYSILSDYESAIGIIGHLFYKIDHNGNLISDHKSYANNPLYNIYSEKMIKLNKDNGYACISGVLSTGVYSQVITFLDTSFNVTKSIKMDNTPNQFTIDGLVSTPSGNSIITCGSMWGAQYINGCVFKINKNGNVEWGRKTASFINNIGNGESMSFMSINLINNQLNIVGNGGVDGAIVAILDSNANGLCNSIPLSLPISNITYSVDDTLIMCILDAISVVDNYLLTDNSVFINKYIYCGEISGIEDEIIVRSNFYINPNPVQDILTLRIAARNSKISIYDLNGKLLISKEIDDSGNIDVSNFAKGIYIIKVQNKDEVITQKFIKE
jgi:hypothetical protein